VVREIRTSRRTRRYRHSGRLARLRARAPSEALIADEREVPQWGHRSPLEEPDGTVARGPFGEPLPGKFGTPAEPAGNRCKALLKGPPRAVLGADMVHQDDLKSVTPKDVP
jgi:hypothetical protein